MGHSDAESEALRTKRGATSLARHKPRAINSEKAQKRLALLRKEAAERPSGIVPCKSSSWMYAPRMLQSLEEKFGYPAGRMFASGVIEFGRPIWEGFGGQVHEGRMLGPVNTSIIIKTVKIASEKGIEVLPYLLQEARAYEDLQQLAGKCLARFFGSGILDNQYALVLEKVPGKMLQNLSSQERAECRERVLEAYDALHASGYVQGDVSSSNVLVDTKRVTIVDLGFAAKVPRSSKKIKLEKEVVRKLVN